MPVIPFAATVGSWLGASAATAAAVGGTAIVAGAALGASAYMMGSAQSKPSGGSPIQVSTDTGAVTAESVEAQAAQRRLARLSKYFTSPTGVLNDASTGRTGVFS
jgi:hypothetical protein